MKVINIIFVLALISACSSHTNNNTKPRNNSEGIGFSSECRISDYISAKDSTYILPYPVGKEYVISQGNCGQYTHKPGGGSLSGDGPDRRYAYDFAIPIGEDITAAKSGVVINIEEKFPNNTNNHLHTNYIAIKQDDGTIATYLHMTTNGVLVEVGDEVMQGEKIGIAGSSGYTGYIPHLHFEVYKNEHENCQLSLFDLSNRSKYTIKGCKSIPITFKNSEPLDTPLRFSKRYKSIDY